MESAPRVTGSVRVKVLLRRASLVLVASAIGAGVADPARSAPRDVWAAADAGLTRFARQGPAQLARQEPAQPAPPSQQPPGSAAQPGTQPDVYTPGRDQIVAPRVVSEVRPNYTPEAMRQRIQGTIRLRGIVERDGTVSNVEVVNSLDAMYGLDQAAVDAFKQWRFQPGTLNGNPVRVVVAVDIGFVLRDSDRTQAWPEGFAVSAQPQESTEETVEARGMRLRIARPATWVRRSSPPNEWVGIRATDSVTYLSVLLPEPAAFELQWPAPDALVNRLIDSIRRAQPVPDAQTLATGQIQGAGPFWFWTLLRLPSVPAPAGIQPDANPFSEARTWMFMATVNGQAVGVSCSVLIPRGATAPAVDAIVRKAAAELGPIVNSIRIEAVP